MFVKSVYRKLRKFVEYTKYIISRRLYPAPRVCNAEETLKKIIHEKCSIVRYGDGELNLILGNSIDFQAYNNEISERLREILTCDDSGLLVGLPDVFRDRLDLIEKTRKFWNSYNFSHWSDWGKVLQKNKMYYDATVTRFYLSHKDKTESIKNLGLWKQVWNGRNLVIIEGKDSRLGVGNDLFSNSKSIKRILCPSINAYAKYNKIFLYVCENVHKDDLILIALGPTATVLAYDLFKQGYQALDVGHIDIEYEWMLMNATEKTNINGKYTNEVEEKMIGHIDDPTYERQVIARILDTESDR